VCGVVFGEFMWCVYIVCVEMCVGLWCVCVGVVFGGVWGVVCVYEMCWNVCRAVRCPVRGVPRARLMAPT